MEIIVCSMAGTPVCAFTANRSQTVFEVKEAIHASSNIIVHTQRLLWGTTILRNADVLGALLPAGGSFEFQLVRVDKWIQEVEADWRRLRRAPCAIQNDRAVVLDAIDRSNGHAIKYASDQVRADRGAMLAAMQYDPSLCRYARGDLRTDRAIILAALQGGEMNVRQLPWHYCAELCGDREFMLAMVRARGTALRWACGMLRGDRELVCVAVQQDSLALEYACAELRADRQLVLAAVQHRGQASAYRGECALAYACTELRADRQLVRLAVQCNAWALPCAAPDLQADRELLLIALGKVRSPCSSHPAHRRCAGPTFMMLSQSLQVNQDDVASAISGVAHMHTHACCEQARQEWSPFCVPTWERNYVSDETRCAMRYAPPASETDHAFILPLLQRDPNLLSLLGPAAQADRAIALEAVRNSGRMLQFASEDLRGDVEVVLAALRDDAEALQYVPEALRSHREVALLGMQEWDLPLPKQLLADREVVMMAAAQRGKLGVVGKRALRRMTVQTIIAKYALTQAGGDIEGGCA